VIEASKQTKFFCPSRWLYTTVGGVKHVIITIQVVGVYTCTQIVVHPMYICYTIHTLMACIVWNDFRQFIIWWCTPKYEHSLFF